MFIRMMQALLTLPMKAIEVPFTVLYNGLRHWYVVIIIPAVFAAFYFYGGLQKNGLLRDAEQFIVPKMQAMASQVKKCEKNMREPRKYFTCISDY